MKINSLLVKCLLMVVFLPSFAWCQVVSLNGKWSFGLDPMGVGEQSGWHKPWELSKDKSVLLPTSWDQVTVPHCWNVDVRYNFTGKAWYRKGFELPKNIANKLVLLKFEAVFYKCRIFLNGELVGMHEGGYTPFAIDVSHKANFSGVNFLSVEVDNSWNYLTVPGARLGNQPNDQLYPWYEYGGITRDVAVEVVPKVRVAKQKIETAPDLQKGGSKVKIISWIANKTWRDTTLVVQPSIAYRTSANGSKPILPITAARTITIKAWSEQKIVQDIFLNAASTRLWDFDNPNLYDVTTSLLANKDTLHSYSAYFGIREFKQVGTKLLLNGQPIRVAGANRQVDHPVHGATEPASLAQLDMGLQRNGNMVMSRLCHTPTSKHFFKWADENGYLLIPEIPNWGVSPVLMNNEHLRATFYAQMKEMVEAYWNSPSVIAWSVGNEYPSWTPEGDEWTRVQIEKYKNLDSTRLCTFASLGGAASPQNLLPPYDSYRHCDFLCTNIYTNPKEFEKLLQNIHQKYPDKPVYVSEFGMRSDWVKNEQERIDNLKDVIAVLKQNPYVVGCSYWSFNDYLSRFAFTKANGYREWGIVDPQRKPRALYKAFQTELSPVLVTQNKHQITIQAKADFPSYTLINYQLVVTNAGVTKVFPLKRLSPGELQQVTVEQWDEQTRIVVQNARGVKVYDSQLAHQ